MQTYMHIHSDTHTHESIHINTHTSIHTQYIITCVCVGVAKPVFSSYKQTQLYWDITWLKMKS